MSIPTSPAQAVTSVAVIVPTLNEVENIDELLTAVLAQAGPTLALEVIVVDDGSKDGTQERVRQWESKAPVRLLVRDATDGLIGAVVEGSRLATTEIVVVMDADLSHPPKRIPDLVQPIIDGERDMVIGSRYVAGGATPGWPMRRRFHLAGGLCLRLATDRCARFALRFLRGAACSACWRWKRTRQDSRSRSRSWCVAANRCA